MANTLRIVSGLQLDTTQGARSSGYASPAFAATHRHEGTPVELRRSGSWLIRRQVPGAPGRQDASGCYPLLVCTDWGGLAADLEDLEDLVAVTAVTDPLAGTEVAELRRAFPDHLEPYKVHHVVELDGYSTATVDKHHRRNVALGHRACTVSIVETPTAGADEWGALYAELVRRHAIVGRADLPAEALRAQLAVPGAVLFRATVGGELAGMLLWMRSGERAYYHLGAHSEVGYRSRSSYALFDVALRHFQGSARFALLGSSAGIAAGEADDGLARFKRGWGTVARQAHIGGRVVDAAAYRQLAGASAACQSGYFPSYRAPRPPVDGAADRAR